MVTPYGVVRVVLDKAPEDRQDFEVDDLMGWFRKHVYMFHGIKSDALFQIIKYAEFTRRKADEVIIKQGDPGDCMYVILRGRVTVYIQYNKSDSDDRQLLLPPPGTNKSETLRHSLGTFVTHLGPGEQFGEIALIREEIRSASIVTDYQTDLVVIHRDLYGRSVKFLLEHDFAEKTYFVNEHPQFRKLAPRYKKQLAMAILKRKLSYNEPLQRQGQPADAIFYVLRGELKMVMDPMKHRTQFPKLVQDADSNDDLTANFRTGEGGGGGGKTSASESTCRLAKQHLRPIETCLLGRNENVGEVEILLRLPTYLQSTISTRSTEVLVLELKHFDRILSRRNVRVIEAMTSCMTLRLTARASSSRLVERRLPLLTRLKAMADESAADVRRREEARLLGAPRRTTRKRHDVTGGDPAAAKAPPDPAAAVHGAPAAGGGGQQQRTWLVKAAVAARDDEAPATGGEAAAAAGDPAEENPVADDAAEEIEAEKERPLRVVAVVDPLMAAEESLVELEKRISCFVSSIGRQSEPNKRNHSAGKVERMHRIVTPEEGIIRPGVVVVVRPKSISSYGDDDRVNARRLLAAKKRWQLEYYRLALNSLVPNFDDLPSDAIPRS